MYKLLRSINWLLRIQCVWKEKQSATLWFAFVEMKSKTAVHSTGHCYLVCLRRLLSSWYSWCSTEKQWRTRTQSVSCLPKMARLWQESWGAAELLQQWWLSPCRTKYLLNILWVSKRVSFCTDTLLISSHVLHTHFTLFLSWQNINSIMAIALHRS